jgi:ketosteroid isomerase-like protein
MSTHDFALDDAVRRSGVAWAAGDRTALDALLSSTYTHSDVFGRFQDRAAWLAYASGRAGRATRIAFRDVRQRIIGDVAIITGINEVEGPGARDAADTSPLTLRFSQVWVKRDGRWLREAFQATPVSERTAS